MLRRDAEERSGRKQDFRKKRTPVKELAVSSTYTIASGTVIASWLIYYIYLLLPSQHDVFVWFFIACGAAPPLKTLYTVVLWKRSKS